MYTFGLGCVCQKNLNVREKKLFCTPTYSRCENLSTPELYPLIVRFSNGLNFS